MRFTRRRRRHSVEDENSYWVSFTDIMSSLLILFILAAVALMVQLMSKQDALGTALAAVDTQIQAQQAQQAAMDEQQSQFDAQIGTISEAEHVRAEILEEMQSRLQAAGIQVVLNEDSSVLSIPSSALGFDSGNYDIAPAYRDRAATIGVILSDVLRQGDRTDYLDTVFIEGHTDSVPFEGPLGMNNWGLSTFRAISLWQLWDDTLPKGKQLDTLNNAAGAPLFSVSGYADTRPVAGTPQGASEHAPNRRIDIRITIVRPSSDELQGISDEFASDSSS
ncbi:OmpA/MotB family protein [Demequina soli]|uniref:OmpA/MotB family protein n=1 Tax=Demequina soli TaxID=1638987 RepID=UPI000783A057|nr:OmpA family protein [Demequina soli]